MMGFLDSIDINEKYLLDNYPKILDLLLIDNTTKKNIIWATDSYKRKGYRFKDNISPFIIGEKNIIKPRSQKSKTEQTKRSKDSAEVFTPSWMCNKQNNLIDNAWFGKENVFNKELDNNTWEATESKIEYPEGKTWVDYVKDIRMEITCGEAPYIVSRYDTVTGNKIELKDRIGLLDRKLRVVNDNTNNKEDWVKYSIEALKATYGYEWQGDNLLLARENVLFSYFEYYYARFNELPSQELMIEVATIISWNLWQMDGIKCVIPESCQVERIVQINLFGEEDVQENGCVGCAKGDVYHHNGIYAKIMDWEKNKKVRYVDLLARGYTL
jgi:hypothetical protein